MKLYFAYGANLNRDSMSWRCPRARPLRSMYLPDYQLEFSTHATIRPEPGESVAGALWEISPECEESLDRFEGYPVYYHKRYVRVDSENIMFYAMPDPRPCLPTAGYLTTIAEGYADWDLDLEYLWHAVRSTEEMEDDLYRSPTRHAGDTLDMVDSVSRLDLGHDLRQLRDMESAYTGR
jgi:gamma-glutamylcyclotransferase